MEASEEVTHPISGQKRQIPPDVTIRPGKAEDQTSITELGQQPCFVDQWDFLTGLWSRFMTDPNILMVVAEQKGKLVAVIGLHVTGGGKHWLNFGARFLPCTRSNNVLWACMAHKYTLALKKYSAPEKVLAVIGNVDQALGLRQQDRVKFQAAASMKFMFAGHRMNATAVRSLCDHVMSVTSSGAVHILRSADEFAELLSDPTVTFDLFPGGYFRVTYSLHEAVKQSAFDIWEPETRQIAVGKSHDGRPATVSIATLHSVQNKTALAIEFHGFVNFEAAVAHCKLHLPYLKTCLMKKRSQQHAMEYSLLLVLPSLCNEQPLARLFHHTLGLTDRGVGVQRCLGVVMEWPVPAHVLFA